MITEVHDETTLASCVPVIRAAFQTVADELQLTESNASSNPAFMTVERLIQQKRRGTRMFAWFEDERPVGFVAVQQAGNGLFYVERLAVVPECRHRSYGTALMDFACARAREHGGQAVSIGIVEENRVLKRWYQAYGFVETAKRIFPHLPFTVCFMEKQLV